MEREALTSNMLATAQAAHNSDGTVIAQVERVIEAGSLGAREVDIPGVVEAPASHHMQTYGEDYSGACSGEIRVPQDDDAREAALTERKVIARRAAMELVPDAVVNLGVGVPETIPGVANEGKISDEITQTVKPGPIGESPSGGISFGAAINYEALVTSPEQFDFHDGGGLDNGYLGMAQIDADGNLNVSRFDSQLPGCGGFINITQNAEKVVFCGTLATGGLEVDVSHGTPDIISEGNRTKFVDQVEQITFSGEYVVETDQPVIYLTERAVFELSDAGLMLTEVAPGIDVETEILDKMAIEPVVADDLTEMNPALFRDEPVDLTEYVN